MSDVLKPDECNLELVQVTEGLARVQASLGSMIEVTHLLTDPTEELEPASETVDGLVTVAGLYQAIYKEAASIRSVLVADEEEVPVLVDSQQDDLRSPARRLHSRNGYRAIRGKQLATELKLSFDRKVSPQGTYEGERKRWVATLPNSFGLPAGESCPGKTPFCESCYAVSSEQGKGVKSLVDHNLDLLRKAEDVESMTELLSAMVGRYENEANRAMLPSEERIFRIHWDGDFFSTEYAEAWATTIKRFPDVQFWAYTRSFRPPVNVVPILAGIDNLSLYLSVDEWNSHIAQRIEAKYPDVRLAYCARDYNGTRALAASFEQEKPGIVCPENAGRVELMNDGRGACVDCQVCPIGKVNVQFAISHSEAAGHDIV